MPDEKRGAARDLRLMPCQAGGRSYYLDASLVRSVYRKEEWRLNWRSESPLGWVRFGGAEVPILDLAKALGVSHTLVADNAVVVETGDGPKAWGVGGVGRVVQLAQGDLLPVPEVCWTEDSPPWIGLVTGGEGARALCLAPDQIGAPSLRHAAENASAVVPAAGSSTKATGRAILFGSYDGRGRLPEVRFFLGFAQVAELLTAPPPVPVPSSHEWLLGLMVWRGRSVPVIDLGWGVTGKSSNLAPDSQEYLIARVSAAGAMAAVPLHGRPEAVELPLECEREPAPRLARPAWFGPAFKRQYRLFLTPVFPAILASAATVSPEPAGAARE